MPKNKPKITIFHCTMIYTGGGERIVLGQIKGLRERGYEVDCLTPILDKKRCYPDIIDQYPISTFLPQLPDWVPFRHGAWLVLSSLLVPIFASRFKETDLFLGENQPGTWLAFVTARLLKKPYLIYTCHPNKMVYPRRLSRKQLWKNQADFYWLSLFFEPFKPILRFFDRLSFSGSQRPVLTNGFFIGREFAKIYQTRWKGCPSGAPFIKEKDQLLANNNVFEGELRVGELKIKKPYLLYVGRHEVWKRIDLAIKALAKVVKEYPEVRLVVYGPFSEHTKALKKLAVRLGLKDKVVFIPGGGRQADLKQLYFNATAYVFPSQKEDFGIVIIEAMGAGVPVVAWRSGGPTDIVVDGRTGFLAKPFSIDDFAQKTLNLLKDKPLRQKMGLASWQRVKDHFSWEKHLNILEEEIKKALGKGNEGEKPLKLKKSWQTGNDEPRGIS